MAKSRNIKNDLRKRTSNVESLSSIINNVLKTQKLDEPLNNKRAEQAWEEVAGAAFLKYTTGVHANKGILYINLSSSVVRNELMMARSVIIKSINKHLGNNIIKDIVFR